MDREEALTKISMGSTVIVIGFLIGTFFQYLVKAVLARFLGPASYGVFVQGLATVQSVTVISLLGLQMSVPRFISYYKGSGDKHLIEKTTSTAFCLIIVSAVVMTVALYCASEWISMSIFGEPALVTPLKLFSLTVLPLGLIHLFISLLRGMQDAKYKIYLENIILSGSILLLVAAFLVRGYGINGAVYAYIIAQTITVIAGYYIYRKISDYSLDFSAERIPGQLISFSWPLFVISMLFMMNERIDTLMLGVLKESAQVGFYNVSYGVAGVTAFLLSALGYMFMPVISELYGEGSSSEVLEVYTTSTRWIFTVMMPLFAGLLIFPDEVLEILFGSAYNAGSGALIVLALGFSYKAAKGPAGMILQSSGKTKQQMAGEAVTTASMVALNLLLIPAYGIEGAAIATTTGFILGGSVLLLLAKKEINGYPYDWRYLRVIGAALGAAGIIYSLKLLLDPGLLVSVILGAVLVIIYLVFLHLFKGIKEEDWNMLWKVVNSVR